MKIIAIKPFALAALAAASISTGILFAGQNISEAAAKKEQAQERYMNKLVTLSVKPALALTKKEFNTEASLIAKTSSPEEQSFELFSDDKAQEDFIVVYHNGELVALKVYFKTKLEPGKIEEVLRKFGIQAQVPSDFTETLALVGNKRVTMTPLKPSSKTRTTLIFQF